MSYRFVHAADIHLDSPLRSLALRDPALAELIGLATRDAFQAVIDLCLDEQVDALLLAGDLYDGDQTSMKTARFLAAQLHRLHEAGIQVFIIRGNHDALSRITRELTFPDSVMLFPGRAQAHAIPRNGAQFPVTIHGLSFAKPHAPDGLLGAFRPPEEGSVNIGLMHTSLDGTHGHDPYAPVSLTDLQASGFRYWALGHIHRARVVEGDCTIVMPGMPQGRDIGEAGAKSVALVTIADDRTITVEQRPTAIAQFERIDLDTTKLADWHAVVVAAAQALGKARDQVAAPHLIARLRLHGQTPLAWRLRRDADLLATDIAAQADTLTCCWIDRVENDTTPPGAPQATPHSGDLPADPIAELRRLIQDEVANTPGFRADAEAIANELRTQLPPECRAMLGDDPQAFEAIMTELAKGGVEDVVARLHAAEPT